MCRNDTSTRRAEDRSYRKALSSFPSLELSNNVMWPSILFLLVLPFALYSCTAAIFYSDVMDDNNGTLAMDDENNATLATPAADVPYVSIETNRSRSTFTSTFQIGVSHVDNSLHPEWGKNAADMERMMDYLQDGNINFQNIHIMGWGPGNPNPAPGVYDWSNLDAFVGRVQKVHNAEVVLTLCTAPGWMKTSGEDWNMTDKVAEEHYDDFAELCSLIGKRYADVKYFQIWNEQKGWWMSDIAGFTTFYNVIYDQLR